MTVKRICECIVRNEHSILPVSTMIHGDYGIEGVALSLPTVVGQNGMDVRVPIHLNEEEIEQLRASAKVLKETLDTEFPE
jgi:L-lactate dehydrogenase